MSEEHDLKKSEEGIGQLYPILEAKDGEIIDGFHREEADKNWKRIRLEHIDTEEKKTIARLAANFHRRTVPYSEKEAWINGLAQMYLGHGVPKGEIAKKISETAAVRYRTVLAYLRAEYKMQTRPGLTHASFLQQPASQRLVTTIAHRHGTKEEAKALVERHHEEVIAEEKPKIEQEVKAKLLKSPTFQREVIKEISKPRIITPSEPCPSGVCELPPIIEGKKPVDVITERIEQFWIDNPQCQCKQCARYGKCGVIR